MRSKTSIFYNNILQSKYDLIALTETFLTSSVSDGELFPAGYVVIRNDRDGDTGWGGTLLAVRDCYSVHVLRNIDGLTPDKEVLFAVISSKLLTFLCCVVYLPPRYNDEQYFNVLTCIENAVNVYPDIDVLIMDDFNLNSCSAHTKRQFNMFAKFCNLTQFNTVINSHGSKLDLVLSDVDSDRISVQISDNPLVPIDSYHPALEISVSFSRCPVQGPQLFNISGPMEWNWRKADYQSLYTALKNLDWANIFEVDDVNVAVTMFYSKIYSLIDLYVPLKQKSSLVRGHYPNWFTREIIQNIKNKFFHLKKFKSEGQLFNKELFRYYRWRVKLLITKAYQEHLNYIQNKIFDDPTKFWEYIKDKRGSRNRTKSYVYENTEVTGQFAADAFARYFRSVFHYREPYLNPTKAARAADALSDARSVSINVVDARDLVIAVSCLKPKLSSGPDGIPVFLGKDCISVLQKPLLFLYNLCIKHSKYPDCWKLSRVTPIPKGSGNDVSTFRPIAVQSVFAKIFETILNCLISHQIGDLLHHSQHGFRKARSTTTNLIALSDYVCSQLDLRRQVDAAYFDFRKAFDLVDNDILLNKMALMGFTPKLLDFFSDYLRDRCQFVRVDGFESFTFYTRSGVSQGSTLGPTLFLIMINDLPDVVRTAQCLLFADDLKLYMGITDAADAQALQVDIGAVAEWSSRNRLPLNIDKCKSITFTRKRNCIQVAYKLCDAPLERVNSIRDLGLTLDTKFDFREHVTNICEAANKSLGFIIRTSSQFGNLDVARVLFNCYVRSKLEYAAIIWDPHTDKQNITVERVQRKFARYLYKRQYGYYPYLYPSLFVYGMVGLETLCLRRKLHLLIHYLRILHNKVDSPVLLESLDILVPSRIPQNNHGIVAPRRRPRLLHKPATRTQYAAHAPTIRALHLISDLLTHCEDLDLFADKISVFCKNGYKFINEFYCII